MNVVIAPDSFKESLDAANVAEAIAEGVLRALPEANVDLCPMADGGEGTVPAMVAATGGSYVTADVFDPLGRPIRARFGLLGDVAPPGLPGELGLAAARRRADGDHGGREEAIAEPSTDAPRAGVRRAVIEMAAASGLALVPADLRDPLRTTTFGTGQLIREAMDRGAREILVGVGGSATVDGGAGCAQALGATFLDASGEACVCGLSGGGLADVARIDLTDLDPRLADVRVRVACDVTNPLLGPDGAARVYGPQKGATPEAVETLEANLAALARAIREATGRDVAREQGAGAAGGLAAGLMGLAGATLCPGAALIAEAVGLARRLRGADLCITGEGKLDRQSGFGKTAVCVANVARLAGVAVVCIAGVATDDAPTERFEAVWPLVAGDVTVEQSLAEPERYLAQRADEAVRSRRA